MNWCRSTAKQHQVELADELTLEAEQERHSVTIESIELDQEANREARSEKRRAEQTCQAEIGRLEKIAPNWIAAQRCS